MAALKEEWSSRKSEFQSFLTESDHLFESVNVQRTFFIQFKMMTNIPRLIEPNAFNVYQSTNGYDSKRQPHCKQEEY